MSAIDAEQSFKDLGNAIIKGEAEAVVTIINDCLAADIGASEIINEGMIPGMDVVGELFRTNQYYVPEVLISARAMKGGMAILRPILAETGVPPVGEVVIGTVRGDLHDIGKNLVAMMLEGAGFSVHDTGIDTHPDEYVQTSVQNNANIIGMSALLTTTMTNMRNTIEAVEAAGLADKVHCIVGGAPVTQRYADEIGADGYAADAASAVILAKRLRGVLGSDDDGDDMGRALYLRARDALQVAVREEPGNDSHSEGLMEAEGLVEQARAAGYELTHIDRIMAEIDREKQRTA
jgi:5-methyltetrahydrofolate--homocysteine methyltransferase